MRKPAGTVDRRRGRQNPGIKEGDEGIWLVSFMRTI
jgi:hypothetical protein